MQRLAIEGGQKLRTKPFPARRQFDQHVFDQVKKVFEKSWEEGRDFGFQGYWENQYTQKFTQYLGGGFADAVATGSAGMFVALSALECNRGDEILISPVNDPGSISAVILNGLKPVVVDSDINSFNMSVEDLKQKINDKTKAVLIAHIGGIPASIKEICAIAQKHGLKVIEDCSQAHGARIDNQCVGTFGDLSVFSTMFSKGHATGGCGGVVFTKSPEIYALVRRYADRGKSFDQVDYDAKNPAQNAFPAMNLNIDELSCAIGISTLSKLENTIKKRNEYIIHIKDRLKQVSRVCRGADWIGTPSPFFYTIEVDIEKINVSKEQFAQALLAEGIPLNPDYRYVVSEWPWVWGGQLMDQSTPQAINYRNRTFNLLFHETCGMEEIEDTISSILKVEKAYS